MLLLQDGQVHSDRYAYTVCTGETRIKEATFLVDGLLKASMF